MEKLSFGNDGKWRTLCNEKDLYIGPNWAEEHVDLLNGLYDKEITEEDSHAETGGQGDDTENHEGGQQNNRAEQEPPAKAF